MAPRRRAVEQATLRRNLVDRLVVLVLAVVATSGLMSVLPAPTQRAVSQLGCRALSLGLGTCGAPGLDLQDTQLTESRCAALSTLDAALPEVRVRELTAAQGLAVTVSSARSGDVTVQLGSAPQPPAPVLLAGQTRGVRDVIEGVQVPAQAEWYLPRGQGLEQLVVAVQDGHHRVVQSRSALGLVAAVFDRRTRTVARPSLLYSSVSLAGSSWPRLPDVAVPPRRDADPATGARVPAAAASSVRVQPSSIPATLVHNRVTEETSVVAPLRGRLRGQPVTGTVRWTRDAEGTVTSLLVAVVAPGRLAPGEPRTSLPGPAVAYIAIPVRTAPEQALVESWLSRREGLTVPLDELLGLEVAPPTDQLGSFLTRAATVTILRYGLVEPAELDQRVATELRGLRRQEWEGIRMVEAATIAPQPNGTGRRVSPDLGCRT